MSLLDDALEPMTIINKSIVDDGYGGTTTVWTDGATIQAAAIYDSSSGTRIAMALGDKSTFNLIVRKDINLDFHTVLRRKSDGLILRITNNSDDLKTPASAKLNTKQYRAEEWALGE